MSEEYEIQTESLVCEHGVDHSETVCSKCLLILCALCDPPSREMQ